MLLFPFWFIEGNTGTTQTSGFRSFSRLVKRASPSVVNISAVRVEAIRLGQKQNFSVLIEELREDIDPPASAADRLELGMVLQQVTPELARQYELPRTGGLLVVEVEIDSEAYDAGIEPGDIILEVDQIPVKDLTAFSKKIDEYGTDQTVLLLVDRGGSTFFVTLRARQL